LRRDDLFRLWQRLGVADSVARAHVTEMCKQYDVDGTGVIYAPEFSAYVTHLQQRAAGTQDDALRASGEEGYLASGTSVNEYIVPSHGTMKLTIELSQAAQRGGSIRVVSGGYLRALVDSLKTSSDSVAILDEALSCMKLAFDEARLAFKFLLKEHGDKVAALVALLPRIVWPADARALVLHANLVHIEDVCLLKASLGALYKPCTGSYDGFYFLDMKDANDQECLARLLRASALAAHTRQAADQGDISQLGDWSCFRNCTYNGESCSLSDKPFCVRPPVEGFLQFDFSYTINVPDAAEKPTASLLIV